MLARLAERDGVASGNVQMPTAAKLAAGRRNDQRDRSPLSAATVCGTPLRSTVVPAA